MKKYLISSAVFILLSINGLFGQRNADIVVPFEKGIETILLNEYTGSIIVKEKNAISQYDPASKKTEWKVTEEEIGKLNALETAKKVQAALENPDLIKLFESEDQIAFIPGSPFIRCVINKQDVIIHSLTGKVVFNSGSKNYRIVKSEFIDGDMEFLLVVTDGVKFSTVLYDLETGTEKWMTGIADVGGFLKQLTTLLGSDTDVKDRLFVAGSYIYASIYGKVYKLDKADGKLLWVSDTATTDFFLSQNGANIIIIKKSGNIFSIKQAINILDANTGKSIWKDDIKTTTISYIEDWSDRVLIAHRKGFNFYSYATGKKIWKKDAKGNDIKSVVPIGKDYLYIADTEMNLIDKDGQSQWKKFIEISDNSEDPVYFLDKVDNNRVLYLTATYGNMVDYSSGKKIWKGNIKFDEKKPLLHAFNENNKTFLVYNDKQIYKFDPKAQDKPEPVAKLKVKEDKSMAEIQLFDWGICLVGQSDVIGVGFDGVEKYHNTYKEPGGTVRRLAKTAGILGSVTLGAVSAVNEAVSTTTVAYRDANGNLHDAGYLFDEKTRKKAANTAFATDFGASALDATIVARTNKRFNALKTNSDYAFVLAKGDNSETLLVKVRKEDGKEVDKVTLDNTRPIYEVDPVTGDLFYVYKNELRIFTQK